MHTVWCLFRIAITFIVEQLYLCIDYKLCLLASHHWLYILYFMGKIHVDTVFCTCQNDQSGLIGRRKVTVYADSRWKSACKDGCRWMVVIDGKVDLDSGVADKVGDVSVDADEGRLENYCRWNRKYADGKEVGENSIVIEADREIDRSWFPFLYLLEYDSCKSHVFP